MKKKKRKYLVQQKVADKIQPIDGETGWIMVASFDDRGRALDFVKNYAHSLHGKVHTDIALIGPDINYTCNSD